jgi:hypothetical protein
MAIPLPRILCAVPQTPHVRLEITKAIQATLVREHAEPERRPSSSCEDEATSLDPELIKECAREFRREFLSLVRSRFTEASGATVKAAVDDPKHPGWPARTPGGKGGQFRPKDATVLVADETEATPGIGHNQGPPLGDPPEVPKTAPVTAQARNAFLKAAARWLARAGVRTVLRVGLRVGLEATIGGPVGDLLLAMEAAYWLYQYLPYIQAYLQPPKTLEELQQDALNPQVGYNIHHIVEKKSARDDRFPEDMIEGSDNLVRIPTLKHWQITTWYQTPNPNFKDPDNPNSKGISPRDYLRGKSWDERRKMGLQTLIDFGVLKP